ncbi:MAG: hypothetical protein QM723_16580 [Myxococcaceae bacterium]
MRRVAWVLMLSLAGCQCRHSLEHPAGTVSASPLQVVFGQVPLGQQLQVPVTVTAGSAPVTVDLVLGGGGVFTVDTVHLELQAGASQKVQLGFIPAQLGNAVDTLEVKGGDQPVVVQMIGEGVAACPQAAACHQVTFDFATRACVDSTLPDHTSCAGTCIAGGECNGGGCVGTSAACDDGDPCTDDACSTEDGGCVHFAHICPVTSACRTAVCLSDAGCTEQPVPDGTSCGPSDCLQSDVCLADACVTLPTPGGSADCKYTSVVASENSGTCATTVSGKLRCWGEWRAPHTLAGSGGAARAAAPSLFGAATQPGEGACTVDSTGFDLRCFGMAGPDGGLGAAVRELDPPCAVLQDDRFVCWQLDGGVSTLASGVKSATVVYGASGLGAGDWIRCLLLTDGGFDCTAHRYEGPDVSVDAPFGTTPDRFLVPAVSYGVCGVWPDAIRCRLGYTFDPGDGGTEVLWYEETDLDAGSITGGGGVVGPGLVVEGNQVVDEHGAPLFSFPNPIVQLTSFLYWGTPCLLDDQQSIWCWGTDRYGGLGQLTGNPHGLQRQPLDADRLFTGSEVTLLELDGGLWQIGGLGALTATGTFVPGQPNLIAEVGNAPVVAETPYGPLYGIDANGRAWTLSRSYNDTWVDFPARYDLGPAAGIAAWFGFSAHDLGVLRASGAVELIDGGTIAEGARAIVRGGVLFRDGGVSCQQPIAQSEYELTPVALPSAPLQLTSTEESAFAWCAWLPGDQVVCWTIDDNSLLTVPKPIVGIGSGIRQIAGSLDNGCALVGSNLAQCWGADPTGEGVSSYGQAVPIVFDEPIAELSVSSDFRCARAVSGHVYCWGHNTFGQLGFEPTSSSVPVKMIH